jgi:hypothetical protein
LFGSNRVSFAKFSSKTKKGKRERERERERRKGPGGRFQPAPKDGP